MFRHTLYSQSPFQVSGFGGLSQTFNVTCTLMQVTTHTKIMVRLTDEPGPTTKLEFSPTDLLPFMNYLRCDCGFVTSARANSCSDFIGGPHPSACADAQRSDKAAVMS